MRRMWEVPRAPSCCTAAQPDRSPQRESTAFASTHMHTHSPQVNTKSTGGPVLFLPSCWSGLESASAIWHTRYVGHCCLLALHPHSNQEQSVVPLPCLQQGPWAPEVHGSLQSDNRGQTVVLMHRAQSDKLLTSHLYTQPAPSSLFPSICSHTSSSPVHLDFSLSLSSVLPLNIP